MANAVAVGMRQLFFIPPKNYCQILVIINFVAHPRAEPTILRLQRILEGLHRFIQSDLYISFVKSVPSVLSCVERTWGGWCWCWCWRCHARCCSVMNNFSFVLGYTISVPVIGRRCLVLIRGSHFSARSYSLSNVILVDETLTSFPQYLRYFHKRGTIAFSIPITII